MTLSIIIPVFNEQHTLAALVERVQQSLATLKRMGVGAEVVIVDDGSTDHSPEIAAELCAEYPNTRVLRWRRNQGKGAAVRRGVAASSGEIVLIQDADLEYDPRDYAALLRPVLDGNADVVYGSRILHLENTKHSSVLFYLGGRLVTLITNLLYDARLTDVPTCYKVFRRSVLERVGLSSRGFAWEPEVTAKLLKTGIAIHEVPVRYHPRAPFEGKKMTFGAGIATVVTLLRYRFTR